MLKAALKAYTNEPSHLEQSPPTSPSKSDPSATSPVKKRKGSGCSSVISQYDFQFDAFLENSELRDQFTKFLRSRFSDEPMLFCNAVERFKRLKSSYAINMEATHIVKEFILVNSVSEVNISAGVRNGILSAYSDYLSGSLHTYVFSQSIFDDAIQSVHTCLKQDSFPQFINSVNFASFIQLHINDENYMSKIAVFKKRASMGTPIKRNTEMDLHADDTDSDDEDKPSNSLQLQAIIDQFNTLNNIDQLLVTDVELNCHKQFVTNKQIWKLQSSDGKSDQYCLKVTESRPSGKIQKDVGVLPFPVPLVMHPLIDQMFVRSFSEEVTIKKMEHIETLSASSTSYSTSIVRVVLSLSKFLKKRELILLSSLVKEQNGDYTGIIRSVNHPNIPKRSAYVRCYYECVFTLKEIADNLTQYTVMTRIDLGDTTRGRSLSALLSPSLFISNSDAESTSHDDDHCNLYNGIQRMIRANPVFKDDLKLLNTLTLNELSSMSPVKRRRPEVFSFSKRYSTSISQSI